MLAFLADMPVPQSAVKMARALGRDARHVREYGMQRAADPAILQRAVSEKRIVLTMDLMKEFADQVRREIATVEE